MVILLMEKGLKKLARMSNWKMLLMIFRLVKKHLKEYRKSIKLDSLEVSLSKISLTLNYRFDEPSTFISAFAEIEYDDE